MFFLLLIILIRRADMAIGENWLIKYNDLEFLKKLGSGTSGVVHKALYKGKKVAVKILKSNDDEGYIEFEKEFKVLRFEDIFCYFFLFILLFLYFIFLISYLISNFFLVF